MRTPWPMPGTATAPDAFRRHWKACVSPWILRRPSGLVTYSAEAVSRSMCSRPTVCTRRPGESPCRPRTRCRCPVGHRRSGGRSLSACVSDAGGGRSATESARCDPRQDACGRYRRRAREPAPGPGDASQLRRRCRGAWRRTAWSGAELARQTLGNERCRRGLLATTWCGRPATGAIRAANTDSFLGRVRVVDV